MDNRINILRYICTGQVAISPNYDVFSERTKYRACLLVLIKFDWSLACEMPQGTNPPMIMNLRD